MSSPVPVSPEQADLIRQKVVQITKILEDQSAEVAVRCVIGALSTLVLTVSSDLTQARGLLSKCMSIADMDISMNWDSIKGEKRDVN